MKNPVVINLNDGLYFHNGDDKVYFVEKKYINKSDDSIQFIIMGVFFLLSMIIFYCFKANATNYSLSIILLLLSYFIYYSIAFFLITKYISNNYIKKYQNYRVLINIEKKKLVFQITKRGVIIYGIMFISLIIGVVWILLSEWMVDNLLLTPFFLAGAFFLVLPNIISFAKFHIFLAKELTD